MLFQINHKSLNANSFIGELFGFFDEIKKQYLSFLTHQIAETDTKLIQYTKDELFLENPKIDGSCFRDLSIEAQYKYVLEMLFIFYILMIMPIQHYVKYCYYTTN